HLTWTTIPSLVIALVLFTTIGFAAAGTPAGDASVGDLPQLLQAHFQLGWHLLIPLAVVFGLAFARFPAYPTLSVGAQPGRVFAEVFQPDLVVALAGNEDRSRPMALRAGAWKPMFPGYEASTANAAADSLL